MAFKFLSVDAFNALQTKADRHDKLVEAINAARAEGYDAELTPEQAVEVLLSARNTATSTDEVQELQSQIDVLTTANTTLEESVQTLTLANNTLSEEVEVLRNKPAATTATIAPEGGDGGADPVSLLDFAKQNAGDPMAIVAKMKEEGIIK